MRLFWKRHRALIGYLALVLFAAALLEIQSVRTTRDLNRHDERSCDQRNRLAENQRAVLSALVQVVRIEIDEVAEHPAQGALLRGALIDLNRRAQLAGPEAC